METEISFWQTINFDGEGQSDPSTRLTTMAKIYRNTIYPKVDLPEVDLLTLLFGMFARLHLTGRLLTCKIDSQHSLAEDSTVLHLSAENPDRSLTKWQLKGLTQRIAHCLSTHFRTGCRGPNKDVVTVMTSGQPISPAVFFGVIAAGGVYSAASPSLTADELSHQVRLTRSEVLICSSEVVQTACKTARDCGIPLHNVLVLESEPSWSLARVADGLNLLTDDRMDWKEITDPQQLAESIVVIIWSSGTTGVPKGKHHVRLDAARLKSCHCRRYVVPHESGLANLRHPLPGARGCVQAG